MEGKPSRRESRDHFWCDLWKSKLQRTSSSLRQMLMTRHNIRIWLTKSKGPFLSYLDFPTDGAEFFHKMFPIKRHLNMRNVQTKWHVKGLTTLVSDTKKYSSWVVPGWITEVRGQTYANPKIFLCEGPEYFSPSFVSVTWRKDNIARLPLKGVKDNLLF